ncbi:RNA-binding domain-containing protein [Planctomycetota bacterium]
MTKQELQKLVAHGEDSHLQFKEDLRNADSLATEMVAFSNGDGGRILIGVSDNGKLPGLSRADVERINQQFISAPIRIFVFTNRIEIISPGHLPNNLTVEKIKAGNSCIRNSTLVTYIAKGLLPYRGIGTGIRRAYDDWAEIDLLDDRDACTFTTTVHRQPVSEELVEATFGEISAGGLMGGAIGGLIQLTERQREVLGLIRANPTISRKALAKELGINPSAIDKHLNALKGKGALKRIGGTRGHWEVIDKA